MGCDRKTRISISVLEALHTPSSLTPSDFPNPVFFTSRPSPQCHYSYSACGLGSDGDRLVQLVQEMQHNKSYVC
ncbi:hypothetical protein L2E82_51244 [Cichorium intybus]|nr:hypothetical protein L2E82_51244 [Cichorium intybus]